METDTADREEDTLVEVRFYIPPGDEEEDLPGAERFKQQILEVGQRLVLSRCCAVWRASVLNSSSSCGRSRMLP